MIWLHRVAGSRDDEARGPGLKSDACNLLYGFSTEVDCRDGSRTRHESTTHGADEQEHNH